jgi:hypothetical protein
MTPPRREASPSWTNEPPRLRKEQRPTGQPPPAGCIAWPARVIAVLIVVPLRLLWELFAVVGRFLNAYVLTPIVWVLANLMGPPLRWLIMTLVVVPLRWLWLGLVWLWLNLVVTSLRWLWRGLVWVCVNLVARPLRWLFVALVVTPLRLLWLGLVWVCVNLVVTPLRWLLVTLVLLPLRWLCLWLIVHPARWLFRAVLMPLGRWLYRYVLVPIGHVFRSIGNGLMMAIAFVMAGTARAVRAVYHVVRAVLAAFGRVVTDALSFAWRVACIVTRFIGLALFHVIVRPVRWVWRTLVRPLLAAVRWTWDVLVVSPARWAWDTVVVSPARWVRLNVLRPAGDAVRSVIRAMGVGGP